MWKDGDGEGGSGFLTRSDKTLVTSTLGVVDGTLNTCQNPPDFVIAGREGGFGSRGEGGE